MDRYFSTYTSDLRYPGQINSTLLHTTNEGHVTMQVCKPSVCASRACDDVGIECNRTN